MSHCRGFRNLEALDVERSGSAPVGCGFAASARFASDEFASVSAQLIDVAVCGSGSRVIPCGQPRNPVLGALGLTASALSLRE